MPIEVIIESLNRPEIEVGSTTQQEVVIEPSAGGSGKKDPYIVSNLTTDLEPFTKAGEYHIVFKHQLRPDRPDTIEIPFILFVQVSPNGDIIQARWTSGGYIDRAKAYNSESWGEWSEQYNYASKADIEDAKQWAAIGWVL